MKIGNFESARLPRGGMGKCQDTVLKEGHSRRGAQAPKRTNKMLLVYGYGAPRDI